MTPLYSSTDTEVAHGLKGVVSHATQLSEVDGQAGRLVIRGYEIRELAGKVSFEEAAYVLWHGDLPNRQQLDDVQQEIAAARHLPGPIIDVLRGVACHAIGMHALRMGAAALSLDEPHTDHLSLEANRCLALRITARMPTLVAQHYRLHRGLSICEPPDHLGFAAGYFYMLEGREPDPARIEGLNAYLVAVLEHGMNASTFVARAIASTDSDMVSAVTGAVASLKGPRHGGVPGPVLEMLTEIGTPDRAKGLGASGAGPRRDGSWCSATASTKCVTTSRGARRGRRAAGGADGRSAAARLGGRGRARHGQSPGRGKAGPRPVRQCRVVCCTDPSRLAILLYLLRQPLPSAAQPAGPRMSWSSLLTTSSIRDDSWCTSGCASGRSCRSINGLRRLE